MKPVADFKAAEKAFAATLRQYSSFSKLTAAEAINKKAKDVAIRTISRTTKADAAKIEATLRGPGRGGGTLVYRLFDKTGMTRAEIKAKAQRLIRARKSAVGYIRAGWYKAAQAFGARGGKIKEGGLAAAGRGVKATPSKTEALLENKALGATEVSGPALAAALDSVRADMMVYIARKLREKWGKRS
jgi:hypothetical protein